MKNKIITLIGLFIFSLSTLAQKVRVEIIEENDSALVINFLDIRNRTEIVVLRWLEKERGLILERNKRGYFVIERKDLFCNDVLIEIREDNNQGQYVKEGIEIIKRGN